MMWVLAAGLALGEGPFAGASWLTVPRTETPIETAHWIWVQRPGQPLPTAQNAPVGTIRLVRHWNLADVPQSGAVWFTADNQSSVRINGQLVGESQAWERVETADIRRYLHAGDNLIEVEATNGPGNTQQNPGGFLFASQATYSSGQPQTLTSDSGWSSPEGTVATLGDYGTAPWNKTASAVPPPVFYGDFQARKPVQKATANVIGLGHFDLFVNDRRQGTGVLNQPWSQYDRTLYYHTFDVTLSLRTGRNSLRAVLGNSFYAVASTDRYAKGDAMPDFSHGNPYVFVMALDITYQDGTRGRVVTNPNWQWSLSPYTYSHVYGGEEYDARREIQPLPRHPVRVVPPSTAEILPITWPEFRTKEVFRPSKVLEVAPDVWSYAFPQNAMAIVRMKVRGKAGQRVEFTPSEVMTAEGKVEQLNLWGGHAYAGYMLSGRGVEDHEWRFFYHGFQYVEAKGAVPKGKPNPRGLPVIESLELVHVRTDNPVTGEFQSSDPLFNQTHRLVDWAMRSNMSYVLSDCPHREKLGWLECSHLLFRSFAYRYDAQAWFRKLVRDMRDIQLPDGRITTVAPDYLMLPPSSPYKFTLEWGAAGVLLPWQAYEWYGDRRFLTENYGMMRAFGAWIDANSPEGILPGGLGDWYDYGHGQPPGPSRYTPQNETATAMAAMCLTALVKSAQELDKPEDLKRFSAVYDRLRQAFQREFYDPATKAARNNGSCQTANAMALCAALIPESDRPGAVEAIAQDLISRDYQQTPGDIGHLYFIRALAESGRSDLLHRVYHRTGVGSYGGILAKGLTTMPETWDAITVGSNSLNHCMLGHVMEWFYGWVAGIRQSPDSVGWQHALIAPEPGTLTWAEGQVGTPRGRIHVKWRRNLDRFQASITAPVGVRVQFASPFPAKRISIDGQAAASRTGVLGRPTLEIPAGSHEVSVDLETPGE